MTMEIPLTQGFVALVDDEDYERVIAAGKWQASVDDRRVRPPQLPDRGGPMSVGAITTEAELAALPERTAVVDRMGDVGTVLGGMLRYPETTPQSFERAAKKYGPFHIVYSPPVPEIAIGTTGTATVASGDAAKGRTFRKAHGMYVGAGKFVEPTGDGTFTVWYTEDWSGLVPDASAPTLTQVVNVICAWDPENGGHEPGEQTHSHDPAAGECYWAMTVGPQLAPLWETDGAS